MRNELYLSSRTGVRASFIVLTCAEGSESSSSRQARSGSSPAQRLGPLSMTLLMALS